MGQACAQAVAAGVEDGVFWGSTPAEVNMLMEELAKIERARQRASDRRAGIIAEQIVNMAGKAARKTVRAEDFFPGLRQDTPENVRAALIAWGATTPGVRLQ